MCIRDSLHLEQAVAVFEGGVRVVHAAGSDDGQETVFRIFVLNDVNGFTAGSDDGGFGVF